MPRAGQIYIGTLARRCGTTPKAIRLYESMGLLPAPRRRGRYRVYGDTDLVLVHMIRRGQAVGFGLEEMKRLITQRASTGRFPLKVASELIGRKRRALREQIGRLVAQDGRLVELQEEIDRTFGEGSEPL